MMEEEAAQQLRTPSKRKKKQDEVSEVSSEAASEPSTPSEEDETETAATSVDDGLPHPRVRSFPSLEHPRDKILTFQTAIRESTRVLCSHFK